MSKKNGTIVIIRPDGTETQQHFSVTNTLKPLQEAVGGYIEGVRVRYKGRVRDAYVNEDGLAENLPPNPKAARMRAAACPGLLAGWNHIVGNLAIWIPDPKPIKKACADCGKPGELTGHMDCQYPKDHT
jgi:Domain of unknown function (DUF3846)